MAGRFVMAIFKPETLMEGGILAVLGAMVEGLRTKSSLLGAVFEISAAAALPVMLLLDQPPLWNDPYPLQLRQDPWQCHPCLRFLGCLQLHPCLQCVSWGRVWRFFFNHFF